MSIELQREQKSFNSEEKQQNKKKMLYELDNIYKSLGEKDLIKDFTARILQKIQLQLLVQMEAENQHCLKFLWKNENW